MSEPLAELLEGIERWRQLDVDDYWIRLSYMGGDLNKVGEHEVTREAGKFWHSKDGGDWRELMKGSLSWLFSVEGLFVWTKDIITKLLPQLEGGTEGLVFEINDDFGYVESLNLKLAKRDTDNMTIEIKGFGLGKHPEL